MEWMVPVALALIVPAAPYAAAGSLTFAGCVSSDSASAVCTQIPGASVSGQISQLEGVTGVAVSPDGDNVYAAAARAHAVARFDRDSATGALSYRDCITSRASGAGCAPIAGVVAPGMLTGLEGLESITVSSDGRSVYTVADEGDAIARFDRDLTTGALSYRDCITANASVAGCTPIAGAVVTGKNTGLDGLVSITATTDGRSVYVAAEEADAIARFDRDPTTGALTYAGCISSDSEVVGCTLLADPGFSGGPLSTVRAVAVSADGRSLYAASQAIDAIAHFDRTEATGALGYVGCITSDINTTGCTKVPEGPRIGRDQVMLGGLRGVAVSADGRSVYTVSRDGDAIARFNRDTTTGAIAYADCITSDRDVIECMPIPEAIASGTNTALAGLVSVTVSADGLSVYTGSARHAIAQFDREPVTGALTYTGCVTLDSRIAGCTPIPTADPDLDGALTGFSAIAVSADGKSAYTDGIRAIVHFNRDPVPSRPSTTTTTLPEAAGAPIAGRRLLLKTAAQHVLRVVASDAPFGSAPDPRAAGASLRIRSGAAGAAAFDASYPLAAGGWKRLGKRTLRGYTFRDKNGPIRTVAILTRKAAILVTGRGAGLGIALDNDPAPVKLTLAIGTMRYCMSFGGRVKFKAGKRYLALNAGPPDTCR